MMGGSYDISIKCRDDAGNEDYGNSKFDLIVDTTPPIVVRVYHEGSSLKLITNEDSMCYYDLNRCNFDITNASSMSSNYGKEHSAEWNAGITYYVKCKDVWGNANPDCAIKVKPTSE